jgi:hypothetical protein
MSKSILFHSSNDSVLVKYTFILSEIRATQDHDQYTDRLQHFLHLLAHKRTQIVQYRNNGLTVRN